MPVVVCVGDSLTAGDEHNRGYPHLLKELLRQHAPNSEWTVWNMGKYGAGTQEWLREPVSGTYVSETAAKSRITIPVADADIIVLMLGTNDAQIGTTGNLRFDEQIFTKRLGDFIRKLKQASGGAKVILAIPPPAVPGGSFTQFFDANVINNTLPRLIPHIAQNLGLELVDCFSPFGGTTPNSQAFSDGIHLKEASHPTLANAVLGAVLRSVNGNGNGSGVKAANQPLQIPISNGGGASGHTGGSPSFLPSPPSPRAASLTRTPVSQTTPTYQIGGAVEIYSKSLADWFPGTISGVDGSTITVDFPVDGTIKMKSLPADHPEVRILPGASASQTTPKRVRQAPSNHRNGASTPSGVCITTTPNSVCYNATTPSSVSVSPSGYTTPVSAFGSFPPILGKSNRRISEPALYKHAQARVNNGRIRSPIMR